MLPKPKQLTPENAARFQDPELVDFYHLRLPYPEQTFDILVALIRDQPGTVLDIGAGTGEEAQAFDEALREAVLPWSHDSSLTLETQARVVCGRPLP